MKEVVITLKDNSNVRKLAKDFYNDGLIVTNIHDHFGIILGTAELDVISKIEKYKEVIDITRDLPLSF